MIRYRSNPHGERRFVEASPEDIRSMRRFVRSELWDLKIPHDDAEDLAQKVEFVTWKALDEGRVREIIGKSPFTSLRAWMCETAWRIGCNHKRLSRFRYEVKIEADLPVEEEARLDARELLARLVEHPEVLDLLIGYADRKPRIADKSKQTAYRRAGKARRWLKEVRDTGIWQEPPMVEKPTPWKRKGKR